MPDIKYFITTPDGNNHQVSEENIKKYGIDSYANSYKDATIRMRNNNGEDYHIPLSNYHDAVGQGLHPFRFDAKPDHTGQPQRAGSAARQVVAEFEASQRKNRQRTPERTQQIENSPSYSTGYEVQTGDYNNPANQWGEKKLAQIEDMGRKATPKIARPTTLSATDRKGRVRQIPNISPISNDYMPGVPMQDNSELPSRIDPNDKSFFSESDVQNANDKIRERQLNEFEGKANALGHKAAGDISRSMKRSNPLSDAIIFGNTGGAVPYSDPDVLDNDDAINAQAITNQVKDARELIREHKNTSKNPLLRAARGAGAAAKDSRTWDNGAQDMADTKAILDAAKRYEEGTASSEQQDLLDVAAIKSSLEGDYGDETGGMYGAGKNLIEMAPYMAKFIINPAQGAGQASAKYVAKVGIEKFGKTAMRSLLGRIARTSARVAGDAASAAVITSAFDQGQIMADANKRMTGDIYSEKDQNGNIGYAGRGGQETSTGKAIGKAITNDFEQNFGEMFGEYFSPVGKLFGKGVEKVASKIGLGKISKMITEASNSDWINGFKNFEKSAQWNGVLGEYGEEVATNMMNATTVGDNTWDAAPGTGVFNKDLNFDTFLGVALGAGFMSAFKSGQYATGKYSAKRNLNASNSLATGLIGETKWNGFRNQINNADDKDISGVMQNILDDESLNDVQKKAVLQYTANLYRYHGANLQDIKSKMEGTTTPQDEAFDKGATLIDPQDRQNAKLSLDAQIENITSLFKDNDPRLLTWLQSDPQSAIQKMKDDGYDENTISTVSNYINTKATYDGMIQGVRDEIDEKVDSNNAVIASVTNQNDGLLHPATMRDGSQMYIVSGNVSLFDDGTIDNNNSDKSIIVRDPSTGEQKMISTNQLESIDQTVNANDYKQQAEEEIRSYFAKQASDEIEGILQFLPGDTYDILDQEGNTKQITIQQPVGDGVNVQLTDGSIVPMSDIQNANNRLNLSQTQSVQSNIKQGDELKLNIGGTEVNATVSTSEDSDGKYQVSLESPVNGKSVLFMNSEDINSSIIPDKVTPEETKEQVPEVNEPITENTPETSAVEAPENDGIVRDEKGMPLYEQSPIESTISDMKKQGADENDILDYSSNMISDLDKESKALSKKKPEFSRDFATYKANKKALADQKEAIEKQKAYWKGLNDAISKPAEPTKTESPSLNKTTENPVIPTVSKQRNTGKYVKENKQMGDYLNLHDRVLRGIASGTKFLWNDDGIKKGLSTELGFKGSEGERRKRIGLIASKDKGGVSIDELAHNIWEEREGQSWQNDDVTDIKNEIISVLSGHNGTRTMIDEAMKAHEQPEYDDDSYEAQNYIAGFANSQHINPEDIREYDSYIDDKTKNYDESASDDELNSIFAEKFLADDENDINNKEDGQRQTEKIQEVRRPIPGGEKSPNGSTGGDSVLQEGKSSSEGSVRQSSGRESSENDNARSKENGNDILPNKSISESGEDQSRPKLDQYEPIFQAAKDKAKELDSEIEKQNNAVSKANKIVERKREEISSRNGLFGDTKSTELFNETSDLSSDNLHKALDKYIKDYDFEKNKLDDLLANRDKKLKDIDEAESKQVNMFTSETPEEANVKRMSDIEERLSDIDSLIMEHEDNNTSDALDMISLNKEKEDLESEYKGLKEINNESKNIQERKFSAPVIENESPLEYAQKVADAHERFKEEQKTNTNPSEAQKEAGNYKKGHIKLDGYDITIENPKGSERSGKDADGKEWHTKMNNTYGYIRGTEGVDGDHIDVYLSDDPTKGDVYVVDQVDPKTGEFDEHKVMYGFSSALSAKRAYLSNYEKGWKGLGNITKVSKEEFKKWVDSSHRKTKPFADYQSVKPLMTIEDLIKQANGKDENAQKAQEILKSRGINWTNKIVKNSDVKRLKEIKDAKYELMKAKRELSVATSKNSPYTESEIEEKRRLVKEAEDHLKELLGNRKEDSESKGIRFSIKNKENFDKRYFEAINNGNMEEAQRIIDNAASLSEYSNLKDYEYAHKAPNSGGTNKEDFRNLEKFRNVVDNGEEYPNLYAIGNGISSVPDDFFTPNGHRFYSEETPSDLESFRNIEKAIHNMKDQLSKYGEVKDIPMVRVYRAVPNSVKEGSVRNGGWVTPSKKYAEIHKENNLPGKGKIIEQDVPADQLWWDGNSINEWGYDDGNNYAYRDTKNNKKLLDVITKDDKGNIISPSKRFNIRNSDIRFNIKGKEDNQDTQLRDALIEKIRNSGIEVITDKEGQNILDKKLKESPEDGIKYSIREKTSPRETGIGYKVFVLKDGKLYPPMVANPNGESTPVGIWLDADSAKIAGSSKTGRPQVKAGGKGTQGGSGKLAYRPGWHLGEIPYALQFNRVNPESGERELFPSNFVWAEVEYSKDVDYQNEAHDEGINENGNYQHSLAGLKRVPEDGSYRYRTNPNPETDEWIITGSMKVNKILSRDEVNNIVKEAGREPQKIQKDDQITQDKVDELNKESENIRYFLTPNGEAYGFVKDGKIYIDTNIAGADTPIHEYTHLWADVLRKENPEEWKNIVSLMKELPIWNEIKDRYTNLKNDDDLADEVLATYSGTRGAKKLIEEKNNLLASESSIFSKAKIVDIFNRFKMAIDRYWHHVADFLNIHYTSAEEVADQALKDLLNGVNPNNEMLHSNLSDENYIKTLDAEDEDISDELEDKYHDDGEKKLTSENIGPILYNMSGRYTKLINMRGVPGMVVHDNETDFNQAIQDYRSVSILGMYQNKLREMLPRCTDAAKERVQKVIDGIDYTLRYYERQADGEEMWRTADQPMFRTAYHGTDKDFDQFDLNHLGEGQGQNIAGNGIYVSDVKGVASKIKDMSKGDGYLYKVNIPDDTGSNYLDWNKTYKGEELQGIVDRIFKAVDGTKDASIKESNSFLNEQLSKHPEGVTGSSLYTLVRFSVDNPSNVLNKAGFVGTKYDVNMDKDYRDTLKGSVLSKLGKKSYSIFNEKDVKILQKEKDESQAKETMPIGKKTEDEISSIKGSVDSVSDKLGGMPVNYVDESNIPDNVKDKIDSTTKGWYDPKDGSVTLYTPNITSEDDAVRTVFHEKLGHEGLKALFGSDSEVNKFGDFIFKSANKELRDEITREAGRNGFPLSNPDGMSHAAQEVFARIAEEGPISENEFSLWRKVKHYVIDLLNKLGLHIKGILSDKDLRYYIKKTAEVLKTQKTSDGSSEVMWRTADQPMFSLHNYSKPVITLQTYYQGRYDRLVNSTANKWKESYQDSMLGLKLLQQEVESESGEKIEDFENAYMAENQLSSKNRYATEFFKDNYFDPMLDEVHSLMKQGASYKDVLDYIMSKHGLERNELFADENEEELGERDYSGLSSIFSESEDYIQDAEDYVANFEEKYNTDALWSKINAATKETLRRSFEGGLLGKEEYEKIRDMFSFYIPLRGWNENVASDFYEYITSPKQVINPAVKKMKGRTSLADDPLATIGNMGESTILQAGRNQMKQKFLNMAMNHESSLLTVKNMWYVNHGTNDNPDWRRDIPEIGPDASADDIHTIVEEHEAKMKELEQAGFATKQRGKIQLKYHTTYSEAGEHVVTVKRDGKEYAIYINGNPRAAQAINGLTNPDASNDSFFLKGVKKLNRQMSANFTSRNPAFVVSNLSRDIIFAGTAVAIKEPWRYTREYSKNIYILAPQMQMWSLLKKAHNGTLSKYIGIERYFKEFLENGGETGYTNLHSTDEYKKMIDRAIMESKGKVDLGRIFGLPPGKLTTATTLGIVPAFRFIAKWTEFLNRSAEDTTRFATFMTSRQMGRSITRSISDAKEITVNFNKKGGNGHGAVFFRSIYLFFNPAVQGLQNMMRIAKDHPARFSTALFAFTAAGFIIPMLNRMLIDAFGGDDDKDSYNNLPEWQRRNNFVFYCGNNHFVMVPLPIELRAFYGLGEMTYQISNGNMKSEEAAKSVLAQMSDLMPVNLTGNNGDVVGNIMPDAFKPIYQSTVNVNYFGKPIYRKNEFNSLMPEYTKAYGGTSKALVKSAKFLNDISGGDNYTPGALNVNPATVEHYFEGYFGGVGVTINQVGKSISALWDEDMRKTRNIPVVNRLLTTSDYNSNSGTTNEKFYKYMEEYELTKQRARGYKKEDRNGSIEYAKRIDFLENSPEYARMEIIDQYNKQLKKYQDGFKKAQDEGDDETANDYKGMISEVKTEIVEELDKIK